MANLQEFDGKTTSSVDAVGNILLVIASRLEDVRLVGMSINKLCTLPGFSEMDAFGIELCVVEAVTNCIEHAYKCEPGHKVEVLFSLHPDRVKIEVRDKGDPMDPEIFERAAIESLESDLENIEDISPRGRGIAIIKEIMDDVSYRSDHGENRLTMVKKIPLSSSQ